MKPLGDGFIKLIKMIIAPIIFCTVVIGIAGMEDMKKVGKTGGAGAAVLRGGEHASSLVLGLLIVNIVRPGAGMNVDPSSQLDAKADGDLHQARADAGHDRTSCSTSSPTRSSTPSPRARSCRCS
jgi:Na+/H+-dicarboxylate symporter